MRWSVDGGELLRGDDPGGLYSLVRDDMVTRAKRANLVDFDRIMAKVPDVPPLPGDELPEGYQRTK